MSHNMWFNVPLTCPTNGARVDSDKTHLYTFDLSPETTDIGVEIGDVIEMTLDDFNEGYFTFRPVDGSETTIRALERWECVACNSDHWVRIEFARIDPLHYRLENIRSVALSPETLSDVHYISQWMESWLEGHYGTETDQIGEIVLPTLPEQVREKLLARKDPQAR